MLICVELERHSEVSITATGLRVAFWAHNKPHRQQDEESGSGRDRQRQRNMLKENSGTRERQVFPRNSKKFWAPWQQSFVRRLAINCAPTWRWSGVGSAQFVYSIGLPRQTGRQTVRQSVSPSVSSSALHAGRAFIMRRFALFSAQKIIRAARSAELDQTISWEYGK